MTQLFNKFYIPEDVGISSVAIAQFLKECDEINYKLRTLHIVRHDKAIAEVSKYPFCALDKRLVYSVSKTFTSTAIGIAVKEGLLRVDDFLLDYFPECRDLDMDDAARTIKICHLLTMSTGHGVDTVGDMCNGIRPWPEIFFTRKIVYEPGTHFVYNSGGTYMLSELISRVTGMCLKDWLQKHLFDPLEITDVSWDKHGDVNTGAWGLLIAPRDLTKLGLLYLHKGVYHPCSYPPCVFYLNHNTFRNLWYSHFAYLHSNLKYCSQKLNRIRISQFCVYHQHLVTNCYIEFCG